MTNIESNPHVESDSTPAEQESAVPPVIQGELRSPSQARRPVWPTVIGIIGIVFGGLGVLQYGCQTIITPFTTAMMRIPAQVAPPGQKPPIETDELVNSMQAQMPITMTVALLAFVLSIWLLTVSISLLNRRPKSPRRLKQWSLCKIAHVAFSSFAAYMMVQAQMGVVQSGMGTSTPFPFAGFGTIMGIVVVVFSFVFYAAYPIFLLIWFSSNKVCAEIASWTTSATDQTILD